MYKLCKTFEIESGHLLSKHKEKCKNPHGHTRKIEIVVRAKELNENDMVCDFKVFKLALGQFIESFDHAILVNTSAADFDFYKKNYDRVIGTEDLDPTTEVLAKIIYDYIVAEIRNEKKYVSKLGHPYAFSQGVTLERVRVWETSSTWAEYSNDI